MDSSDNIAAVATPCGEGGIGIIRISGKCALETGLKVFSFSSQPPCKGTELREKYFYYGHVVDPGAGSPIDDGFFVYMKGPSSYTGEDVVELHIHGGALVLRRALGAVLTGGARMAEPGEFTRRAFLSGRLDLAQAEAVIDVIRAGTDAALSSARGRLEGALSKRVDEIKRTVTALVARTEAALDFPEDMGEDPAGGVVGGLNKKNFIEGLDRSSCALEKLINTFDEGRALREGVRVLILGRPNVGKSSLLNILLREDRAIVTPVPGTTRDVIEEAVNIRGITARLMDTAGLRETEDFVESIGVRAARERISDANLILFVVDASEENFTEDLKLLNAAAGKKVIIVVNKVDLAGQARLKSVEKVFEGRRIEFISALKEKGMDGLEEAVFEEVSGRTQCPGESTPGELITSVRHRDCLEKARDALSRARNADGEGLAAEFVAADLREALSRLGEITGEVTTEDILDRIFSEFCIGK